MTDKVAVVGPHRFSDKTSEMLREFVGSLAPGTVVLSGGFGIGVDRVATRTAKSCGLETEEYVAVTGVPVMGHMEVRCLWNPAKGHQWDRVFQTTVVTAVVATDSEAVKLRDTILAMACTRMVAFAPDSCFRTLDLIEQAKRFRRPVEVIG